MPPQSNCRARPSKAQSIVQALAARSFTHKKGPADRMFIVPEHKPLKLHRSSMFTPQKRSVLSPQHFPAHSSHSPRWSSYFLSPRKNLKSQISNSNSLSYRLHLLTTNSRDPNVIITNNHVLTETFATQR